MQHSTFYYATTPHNGQAASGIICFRPPKNFTTALEEIRCADALQSLVRNLRYDTIKQISLNFSQGNHSYSIFGTINGAPADKETLLQAIASILATHGYYIDDIGAVLTETLPPKPTSRQNTPPEIAHNRCVWYGTTVAEAYTTQ